MQRVSHAKSQQGGYQESGTLACIKLVKTSVGKEAPIPDL